MFSHSLLLPWWRSRRPLRRIPGTEATVAGSQTCGTQHLDARKYFFYTRVVRINLSMAFQDLSSLDVSRTWYLRLVLMCESRLQQIYISQGHAVYVTGTLIVQSSWYLMLFLSLA